MNLMKGAVVLADGASTVSPTYAQEVSSGPELGFGLEGVLRAKGPRFAGILNGADYNEWNPASDTRIAARYTPADPGGKTACAMDLRKRLRMTARSKRALVGMVSRMTVQKGFDLLVEALDELLALELDLVIRWAAASLKFEARLRAAERGSASGADTGQHRL